MIEFRVAPNECSFADEGGVRNCDIGLPGLSVGGIN